MASSRQWRVPRDCTFVVALPSWHVDRPWRRRSRAALRLRDHRNTASTHSGPSCDIPSSCIWSVVRRGMSGNETTSSTTGVCCSMDRSVWCSPAAAGDRWHFGLDCQTSRLQRSAPQEARGILGCESRLRALIPTAIVAIHWYTTGSRACTYIYCCGRDSISQIFRRQGRWCGYLDCRCPTTVVHAITTTELAEFRPLTATDVTSAIRQLPDKQRASDPIPTSLPKSCADVLVSFLTELFNRSLKTGSVSTVFKAAYITPTQKKADLNTADVRSYRSISDLTVLSKLLERLVSLKLLDYLSTFSLLTELLTTQQRPQCSRFCAIYCGLWIPVIWPYWRCWIYQQHSTWSFTTHYCNVAMHGDAIQSFRLCFKLVRILSLRPHPICLLSWVDIAPTDVLCRVPRSVLGPILFLLHTAELLWLVELSNLCPHLYADDMQIYSVCHPTATDATQLQRRISACIDAVATWMWSNRLQLTQPGLRCLSYRQQHQLPQ